jgi:hypothetical protein
MSGQKLMGRTDAAAPQNLWSGVSTCSRKSTGVALWLPWCPTL